MKHHPRPEPGLPAPSPAMPLRKQKTLEELLKDPVERTALALDGDPMTGFDIEIERAGDVTLTVDNVFSRDGNALTNRDTDRALDGNPLTQPSYDNVSHADESPPKDEMKKRSLLLPPAPRPDFYRDR